MKIMETLYDIVTCPVVNKDLNVDLCEEYQMMGNAEFVPRVLESELAPLWVKQCESCESMQTLHTDPFAQPEMVLE